MSIPIEIKRIRIKKTPGLTIEQAREKACSKLYADRKNNGAKAVMIEDSYLIADRSDIFVFKIEYAETRK